MSIQAQLAPVVRARALQKVNTARIRIEGNLDLRVPRRSGRLARSRRTRVLPGTQVIALQIEYPSDVATWTDQGTKAHVIRARRASALRFFWPKVGRVVYFRSVRWKPGPGVARNKRWFRGAVTLTEWRKALR